jgi:hypothetical protein
MKYVYVTDLIKNYYMLLNRLTLLQIYIKAFERTKFEQVEERDYHFKLSSCLDRSSVLGIM